MQLNSITGSEVIGPHLDGERGAAGDRRAGRSAAAADREGLEPGELDLLNALHG